MKVYDEDNFKGLRTFVSDTIDSVLGIEEFLDMVDYGEYHYACKYDIIRTADEEFYIINRETGQYINWYKYTHIGRDIHMNFNPNRLKKFFKDFKKNWEEF